MDLNNTTDEPAIQKLGKLVISINLDTGKYTVELQNQYTAQLTNLAECLNVMPATGIKLFCEELQRRSRSTIVT